MTLSNSSKTYGSITKGFHWLMALMILTVGPVGYFANSLATDIRDPAIASTVEDFTLVFQLFTLHKTLGVAIFLTALLRILWALSQPRPGLLNGDNRAEAFLARLVHWLLYGSLVMVPLSGWIGHAATTGYAPIYWPFGQSLPFVPKDVALAHTWSGLHYVLVWVLGFAVVLHIAGALKHHVIDRDATLRRMLPGQSGAPVPPVHSAGLAPVVVALAIWVAVIGAGFGTGFIAPLQSAPEPVAAQPASASEWQVTQGTLGISITQLGGQVDGQFADWSANITFEDTPGAGPLGQIDVIIAIKSLSLGSITDQALGPDFFDAEFFGEAHFRGEITRTVGTDGTEGTDSGYVATGPLTIRDTSLRVSLPFDLVLDGDTAQMSGELTLNRLDFGIGANMADEQSLGFGVNVRVDLTAVRH